MAKYMNAAIKCAILGNLGHLLLSNILLDVLFSNYRSSIVGLILIVMLWLIVGFTFGYKTRGTNELDYLKLGFISLLPITICLIVCQVLDGFSGFSQTVNYSLFYFLGLPVIMWNKPFEPIMNLFKNSNIYIQFDIVAVVILFIMFLGAYLGGFAFRVKTNKQV